mgnify:CR=1 FL=1
MIDWDRVDSFNDEIGRCAERIVALLLPRVQAVKDALATFEQAPAAREWLEWYQRQMDQGHAQREARRRLALARWRGRGEG